MAAAATAALAIAGSEFLALAAPAAANWKISFAVALILGLLAINALGLREGWAAQIVTTLLKVSLLMAIIAAAIALPAVPVSAVVGAAPAIGFAAALSLVPRRRHHRGDHLVRPDRRLYHSRAPRRRRRHLVPHRAFQGRCADRLNLHRSPPAAICAQ